MPDQTNYHPQPCPFCGSDQTRAQDILSVLPSGGNWWVIRCEECGGQGPRCEGVVDAVEAWNSAGRIEETADVS